MNYWLGTCCGVLGWDPQSFWESQLWECRIAVQHHHKDRLDESSTILATLINGIRIAFHKEKWQPLDPSDIRQTEPERDPDEDREDLAAEFPAHLD